MSERYEALKGNLHCPVPNTTWVVRDLLEDEIIITFWPECPDAESRASQLCAELNAAEDKKGIENWAKKLQEEQRRAPTCHRVTCGQGDEMLGAGRQIVTDELRREIAAKLHLWISAAQNKPYEDGDVCNDCLLHADELLPLFDRVANETKKSLWAYVQKFLGQEGCDDGSTFEDWVREREDRAARSLAAKDAEIARLRDALFVIEINSDEEAAVKTAHAALAEAPAAPEVK